MMNKPPGPAVTIEDLRGWLGKLVAPAWSDDALVRLTGQLNEIAVGVAAADAQFAANRPTSPLMLAEGQFFDAAIKARALAREIQHAIGLFPQGIEPRDAKHFLRALERFSSLYPAPKKGRPGKVSWLDEAKKDHPGDPSWLDAAVRELIWRRLLSQGVELEAAKKQAASAAYNSFVMHVLECVYRITPGTVDPESQARQRRRKRADPAKAATSKADK